MIEYRNRSSVLSPHQEKSPLYIVKPVVDQGGEVRPITQSLKLHPRAKAL